LNTPVAASVEGASARRAFKTLITEQVRPLLEQRALRLTVIGMLLIVASAFSLVPAPTEVDSGWLFIVPVAIAAIAAGLKEGLFVALVSSALYSMFAILSHGTLDETLLLPIFMARFALYGLTAAVLGTFAEAHYSVQSSLRKLASIDPLTKVSNVTLFYEELGLLESHAANFAVLVVDLDDLKGLNDRYGHQAGSAAIQSVARTLRSVVRGSDCVARFGGDEFVVILKDADRAGAQIVVNRMREMLAAEAIPGTPEVTINVSVGVALYGEDGTSSEELLGAADRAMYADKHAHKVVGLDRQPRWGMGAATSR
jgi:diguanylate cyclase (GGDEF)-like protein